MRLAQRLEGTAASIIREMTRLAYEYDAINMSQGFPELDPPPEVLAAATAALHNHRNQYTVTWGTPALRQAIADKCRRWYGLTMDPATDVTVTCGVTEAVIAVLLSLLDPGDRVIILEPAHENYRPGVEWAGGRPLWVPLTPPDFRLDEEALRAAFAQRPRAIILNSPHNPTGRVFTWSELQLIADLCQEYDVVAITDEIYEHIIYDGRQHLPLATLPGMAERTITTSGLSKAYAATGWRIGWVVAPPALSAAVRTIHDYLTICAPSPLQAGAAVALALPDDFYRDLIAGYTGRRARMMAILARAGFLARPPQGSYYVMADFSPIRPQMDAVTFTHWLITQKRVAVVPGSSFYHHAHNGRHLVRFAFPKRPETFDEVERRLTA